MTIARNGVVPALEQQRTVVAVDLGAESCRISLLRWIEDHPQLSVVHRFPNGPFQKGQELRWNLDAICAGVEEGLRRSAELAPEGIASIAVDGWAVDYVRLDLDGQALATPFCYRDERTIAAEEEVHRRIGAKRLYELTGVQRLRINTIYQLFADEMAAVPASAPWINLPEYILYWLGGRKVSEYTNASHTGLVSVDTKEWCGEIFPALGLDLAAAPELVSAGTDVGRLRGSLAALPAFANTRLIAPACHDTASAVAGIPVTDEPWAYISSGTWSLVGMVLDSPNTGRGAYESNFTNLGAAGGKVCFHRNVNGMWLMRQCMQHWFEQGHSLDITEIVESAERLGHATELLQVDDPELLLPGNMPARINRQRQHHGLSPISLSPEAAPIFANLIFHSLAARYAEVLSDLRDVTGRDLRKVYIVGGGNRNRFLNRLTEEASGLEVSVGHVESSTIGNLAIQLAVLNRSGGCVGSVAPEEVNHWAWMLKDIKPGE